MRGRARVRLSPARVELGQVHGTEKGRARNTLVFASATHVWSDLFFAITVPLLPLIQSDPQLLLTYTQTGLLRSVQNGASAVLQVPAGYLGERVGEFWLLVGGNVWVAAGLIGMAAATTFPLLLATTLVAGLGGGTQHPLATSMVSRSHDARGRSTAVGTVNFAGDLGKLAAPALALLLAARYGWRGTLYAVGFAGLAFMAISGLARRAIASGGRPASAAGGSPVQSRETTDLRAFGTLSGVGFLDSGTRAAALAFLPFVMKDKGLTDEQVFVMLLFLLAGGAAGKFVCGWLDDRYGSIRLIWGTKGLTALLLVASLASPIYAIAPLMLVLGIGLNGTSSVLYATVSAFIPSRRRATGYGYYYTATEVGGTLAPIVYGRIADVLSLRAAMIAMGVVTSLILPASLALRGPLSAYAATLREDSRKSRP